MSIGCLSAGVGQNAFAILDLAPTGFYQSDTGVLDKITELPSGLTNTTRYFGRGTERVTCSILLSFCMGLDGSVNFDDDALPMLTCSLGFCLGSRE